MTDAQHRERDLYPASAPTGPLLPAKAWRAVGVSLLVLLAGALYLIMVRGTAILYDLGQGLAAICF